ncbi:M15 family metallopeptidase [Methylobrevis albus]|uniref:D-alanyl-D-alanine carboxypeptidase family protein n=1 Tax=Methylobrevis albus TaxID=2793297 RepID=A0A931I2N6_9HYPH|nr:M15 family metallopeptidase [Methylobrevis albus]MBH0239132.1 D-alanyl-D-alanine carboxypeptidase family protein [Methylobrevis albus]
MAATVGSILVRLDADPQRLKTALASSGATVARFEADAGRKVQGFGRRFDGMVKQVEGSSRRLDHAISSVSGKLATFGKTAALSLGAGIVAGGVTGIVTRLGEVARGVATIGDEAKRAGVSVQSFQELRFVAEQNRIGVDALVDGLKELNLRADEWIQTGGGSAAEAFQRLGYTASELKEKLKDPSALLVEIIGRLENLNTAARIRISDELFGGSAGERFVELVDRGAASIRSTIEEANRLGIVLDSEVIERAAEIDRAFNKIAATVSTRLKGAIVDSAIGLQNFLNSFAEINEQTTANITRELGAIYSKRQALIDQLADMKASADGNPILAGEIKRQEQAIESLAEEAEKLRDILDRRAGYGAATEAGKESQVAKPKVEDLASSLAKTGDAAITGAKGIESYAEAIRSLQGEIPGLAGHLAKLDARAKIESAFQAAASKARNGGELNAATALRSDALRALDRETATRDSAAYLTPRLAPGRPAAHVTGLSGDFSKSLAEMIAAAPESVRAATTITSGFRSFERQAQLFDEAVKKYGSEAAARKWVAPPGKSQHNAGNAADLSFGTDEARSWFHSNAGEFGLGFPMDYEPWHIQSQAATTQQRDSDFETQWSAGRDQADRYAEILSNSREFIAAQAAEKQALGLTSIEAARLRHEQELMAQAQQAGIALTPQQTAQLKGLAAEMANVEAAAQQAASSQQSLDAAMQQLGNAGTDILGSIVNGTFEWRDALKSLIPIVINLLNELYKSGSLGGGSGGGGLLGFLGSLLGGILGFADGGKIQGPGGPRSDSILARVSDGEFLVNAKATRKNLPLLTAINSGIPGFANGGVIGNPTVPASPMSGIRASDAAPIAASGVRFKGGDTIIQGNVTEDVWPKVRAEIAASNQATRQDIMRNFGSYQAKFVHQRRIK